MSPAVASLVAQMYVHVAIIEGMKAENAHREACGNGVAYGEDAFNRQADHLSHISVALRNQQ